jgi:predicted TIM-barrel fold metal-dependent hydrolase
MFAALPLPDVDGALAEMAYAYDVLKTDGIGLWSSYGTTYLGDPTLAPVLADLDKRHGVAFVHPTDAACCVNPVSVMSETVIEFGAETGRTIGSLVFSGASQKYTNASFIFSHGGGVVPFLLDRFRNEARLPKNAGLFPNGVEAELRRLYYDTAFVSTPESMRALLALLPPSHVLLGSDQPYQPSRDEVREMAEAGISSGDLMQIERTSALTLFGRARS